MLCVASHRIDTNSLYNGRAAFTNLQLHQRTHMSWSIEREPQLGIRTMSHASPCMKKKKASTSACAMLKMLAPQDPCCLVQEVSMSVKRCHKKTHAGIRLGNTFRRTVCAMYSNTQKEWAGCKPSQHAFKHCDSCALIKGNICPIVYAFSHSPWLIKCSSGLKYLNSSSRPIASGESRKVKENRPGFKGQFSGSSWSFMSWTQCFM